jgi:hypothetical protein
MIWFGLLMIRLEIGTQKPANLMIGSQKPLQMCFPFVGL